MSFLLGGFKHHVQEYNRNSARLQAGLLFVATIAMLVPSMLADTDAPAAIMHFSRVLSLGLSVLLIGLSGLGLIFTLATHREFFASAAHAVSDEGPWALSVAIAALASVTVLVARISEVFVDSVQQAATALGIAPAFVGFIVVALVGGAAEMVSAFAPHAKTDWI